MKSLAAEAKIIRREESKAPTSWERIQLAAHRRGTVRLAARSANLAYAFLRGRSYRSVEAKCHTPPSWHEVEKLVQRYGWGVPYDNGDWNAWKKRLEEWRVVS